MKTTKIDSPWKYNNLIDLLTTAREEYSRCTSECTCGAVEEDSERLPNGNFRPVGGERPIAQRHHSQIAALAEAIRLIGYLGNPRYPDAMQVEWEVDPFSAD